MSCVKDDTKMCKVLAVFGLFARCATLKHPLLAHEVTEDKHRVMKHFMANFRSPSGVILYRRYMTENTESVDYVYVESSLRQCVIDLLPNTTLN